MEPNTPYIDIVIVNYQSTDYILDCIASIYEQLGNRRANIFVEDNGSTDRVHRITRCFPEVQLRKNGKNLGFSVAVNQGIRRGTAEFVILLNPDSKVHRSLLIDAIDYMRQCPDIAILGPRIFDEDGSVQGSARSFPTPLTALFGRQSLISRLFPDNRITRANLLSLQSDGRTPMEVDWVSGACMLVRRKAIQSAGYLDERFFMYWEDTDWCQRMREKGWRVVYYPLASVVHLVGKSSGKVVIRSTYEFHKSVYLLFQKYNRSTPWVLNPFIFSGLFIRFCFVAYFSLISQWFTSANTAIETCRAAWTPKPHPPIKVMRFIARLNIGGPAIHVHLLLNGLNKAKFQSVLVAGRISPKEGDMGYLFHSDDPGPVVITELQREIRIHNDIRALFKIFQIIKNEKPDIIHTHTAKAGFTARFAVMIYNLLHHQKIKVVHTFHGHVFEGYFTRFNSQLFVLIERIIACFTDVIIAISDSQKRELTEKFRIAPAWKVRTMKLGFDLAPFLNAHRLQGRFRARIGVDASFFLIGIVGRLVPIKNHRMFLDAAKRFYRKHPDMKVRFVIVGDGELRKELESYAEKIGLAKEVIFTGWVRDVAMVYADLDVLALTSMNEGTPVSIIEAMASGVPVLATNAGGVEDLLGAGVERKGRYPYCVCERGVLCNRRDVGSIVEGLGYLAGKGGRLETSARKRVQNACDYVLKNYDRKRLISDMEHLYLELVNPREAVRGDRCQWGAVSSRE